MKCVVQPEIFKDEADMWWAVVVGCGLVHIV